MPGLAATKAPAAPAHVVSSSSRVGLMTIGPRRDRDRPINKKRSIFHSIIYGDLEMFKAQIWLEVVIMNIIT